MKHKACGWLPKSCDVPAGRLHHPHPVLPLPQCQALLLCMDLQQPPWGPRCRQLPRSGHEGITTSFLSPEHSSKVSTPLKEKQTNPKVSEFLQHKPQTLQAGEAPRNLSSRTFLRISQAPFSSAHIPALPRLGPGVLARRLHSPFCGRVFSAPCPHLSPISECPSPSVCRFPMDAVANYRGHRRFQ